MRIIYSDHALKKIKQRNILKEWIVETIKNPTMIVSSYGKRKEAIKTINKTTIKVIYVKESDRIIVITVY